MDIKRILPFAALAIVSYLMVIQWNKDYGMVEQAPVISPSVTMSDSPVPAAPAEQTRVDDQDVPTVVDSQSAPATPGVQADTQLIQVETDVLRLAIDPRGGDIVQLSLPQYPLSQNLLDTPFQLFNNNPQYLYIAQSGLTGISGPDARPSGRPVYATTQKTYRLADDQDQLVVELTFAEGNVNHTKRFTFERGQYALQITQHIDNQSEEVWSGNLFAQLKRDASGDPSSTTATGTATYLGAAIWTAEEPYKKISMSDMDKQAFKTSETGGWVAWLQHYFVSAWVPQADQTNQVLARKDSQGNYIVGFTGQTLSIPPGASGEVSAKLYAGPKIQSDLAQLSPGLELTVDYGFLWFLAQPIFWLLENIHNLVGNWGWSIVFLTIIIKLIFFPLSAASYKSMARMRAVAPKLQALKEQFGEDRQKMSQAMMELYKKEKINPLGGCLPILVQMPVFLALYWVLLESVEMRQAPWILWITDLSIKDPFFLMPIIMGATMFIQMQLNPTPPDPMQAKVMKMMPIIFTFFFLWFPAGLVLYWVVNNILSIGQQWYITRKIEAASKAA
jgi:YidC/Oxa1 family membrane protein insertase